MSIIGGFLFALAILWCIAVEDLLLWRDVQRSAIVFVSITVAYGILEWSNFSLLKIISNTLLFTVVITFLWSNVASYTNM